MMFPNLISAVLSLSIGVLLLLDLLNNTGLAAVELALIGLLSIANAIYFTAQPEPKQ